MPVFPLGGGSCGITGTGLLPVGPAAVGLGGITIGTVGIAANGSLRPKFLRIWLTRASGGKDWISAPPVPVFKGCVAVKGFAAKGVASGVGFRETRGATGVGVL